jgi:hypothetical protein
MAKEALSQDLADFLVTKNFDPEYFDEKGQPAEAGDAKTIKFDYVASTGKNYGTAVCVIADDELNLFYGDNLGRGMEPDDKQEWYEFLEQLSNQAASHSATWSPRDINQLKHTLAGIAAIKEGLFEGYYGTKKVSYMGEQTGARLMIQHNRTLGEADKRFRYVESLFIETADQERFRLPFKSLAAGRAMLEHVRSGGKPYDVRGNHITEIVREMAVLSRFNRAQHHRVFEGVTQELVESARQYYQNLQETMKHLGSPRGYQAYFESWAPDHVGEAESLVENLRDLFVEQTLDARIEDALPTLAKIQQQGNHMKEAQIFENWINNLSEGTWALPETPEQMEKLNQLMSAELIVGPDAINATELLYDIVGDDELFDILNDLADKSEGRANIWDDSDVQRRLAELGIQTPQSTASEPADVPQDTAPAVKEQGMAEGSLNEFKVDDFNRDDDDDDEDEFPKMFEAPFTAVINGKKQTGTVIIYPGEVTSAEWHLKDAIYIKTGMDNVHNTSDFITHAAEYIQDIIRLNGRGHNYVKHLKRRGGGVAEGDIMSTFVEDRELAEMLKYAGVTVKESVLTDSTGSTLEHIKDTFRRDVKDFTQSGDMSDDLYDALYDYYFDDMPYGTKKARTGDPHEWISDRFAQDIGLDEGWKGALAGGLAGAGLGSVVPGLGTLAGGIAGAYAGHKIGDQGISDPSPALAKSGAAAPQRNAPIKISAADRLAQPSGPRKASFQKTVAEGSCNMTMEGDYCPEHGLAECGGMYEDGGAVGMPYSMGEAQAPQDPINYNAAMTGSYYEGKETDIQEGDALLARIKSLALLR